MVSGFLTKKIKARKTLGERFKDARKKLELSVSEAEESTKVRAKYLVALEEGDWNILPQDVYVRAFVMSYAKFLSLPQDEIIDLFETELIINRQRQGSQNIIYKNSIKDTKVLITPRFLAYFSLVSFLLVLVSYIIFQVLNFAGSPNLKVFSPMDNTIVENDSIDISGSTDVSALLTVNSEGIPVTNTGSFSLNLKLHKGVNVVKIQAVNKTKKESSQVLTIEYKPKTAEADPVTAQN